MSSYSVRFARVLDAGRRLPRPPATRESLLVSLLAKRAVAHNLGAEDLEALLRSQIRWSLPVFCPHDGDWVEQHEPHQAESVIAA